MSKAPCHESAEIKLDTRMCVKAEEENCLHKGVLWSTCSASSKPTSILITNFKKESLLHNIVEWFYKVCHGLDGELLQTKLHYLIFLSKKKDNWLFTGRERERERTSIGWKVIFLFIGNKKEVYKGPFISPIQTFLFQIGKSRKSIISHYEKETM